VVRGAMQHMWSATHSELSNFARVHAHVGLRYSRSGNRCSHPVANGHVDSIRRHFVQIPTTATHGSGVGGNTPHVHVTRTNWRQNE